MADVDNDTIQTENQSDNQEEMATEPYDNTVKLESGESEYPQVVDSTAYSPSAANGDDEDDKTDVKPSNGVSETPVEPVAPFEPVALTESWSLVNDDVAVQLDPANADINMSVMNNSAWPQTKGPIELTWTSILATHGVTGNAAKVFYQVKVVELMHLSYMGAKHEIRIGWSASSTPSCRQTGMSKLSYAISSAGDKLHNSDIDQNCLMAFGAAGDVIGCYLDMSSDPIKMSFAINHKDLGVVFEIVRANLTTDDVQAALFPSIDSRNVNFEVNFGLAKDTESNQWMPQKAWRYGRLMSKVSEARPVLGHCTPANLFVPSSDFVMLGQSTDLVRSPFKPITNAADCEMVLVVGPNNGGKSTYVEKFVEEHPEKRYEIISIDALLNRMKTRNQARRQGLASYQWRNLKVDLDSTGFDYIIRMAATKLTNVIIDHAHLDAAEQRKRAHLFGGHQRHALVVCPSLDDWKVRRDQCPSGSDSTVVYKTYKTFHLPTVEEGIFQEVSFAELQRDEATEVLTKITEEESKKPPPLMETVAAKKPKAVGQGGPFARSMGNRRDDRRYDRRDRYPPPSRDYYPPMKRRAEDDYNGYGAANPRPWAPSYGRHGYY